MDFDYNSTVFNAHAKAAGWYDDLFFNKDPFNAFIFYLVDYTCGFPHISVLGVERSRFDMFSPSENDPITCQLFAEKLMSCLAEKGNDSIDNLAALESLLHNYAKSTETFRVWRTNATTSDILHMIINIYPAPANSDKGKIRPSAIMSSDMIVPFQSLRNQSLSVVAHDIRNHPDWFDESFRNTFSRLG